VAHNPALLGPFRAADHNEKLGLCKVAEVDDWQRATDTVNRQMSMMGGKLVVRSARACGSPGDGSDSSLYISKSYECSCAKTSREDKRRDRRGSGGSKACTSQVLGSIKVRQGDARSDAGSIPCLHENSL
jgi:hypothetical protein